MKKETFNELYDSKDIKILEDVRSKKLISLVSVIGVYIILTCFVIYYSLNAKNTTSYLLLMTIILCSYIIFKITLKAILHHFSDIAIKHAKKLSEKS